ncbi:hypothetical protein BDN72DRAFT_830963 [Pluteus cervinus]|uniref:Uncharacterized protein n=1 Tax=Pluteus cervinus TaxID=181527 RepID=A0ACD3BFP7_9AGAR|nr:hypothetical protein BDN72DRAFT_830963 [Pluteus cervinus]
MGATCTISLDSDAIPPINPAPIEKLFPELLSEIFQQCIPPGVPLRPASTAAPLLLTQVCSYWTAVATSNPLLWRSLRIYVHNTTKSNIELVKLWLARSRGAPLNIAFSALPNSDALPIFDLLVSHSYRWGTVDLVIPVTLFQRLTSTAKGFPALNALSIHLSDVEETIYASNIFQTATSLKSLNVEWDIHTLLGGLPYAHLTHLSVKCFSLQDIASMAQRCSGLVEWTINFDCVPVVMPGSSPIFSPITLQRLRTFNLYLPNPTNYGHIFDLLTLPSLQDLQVEDPYFACPPWPLQSFAALVDRSACTIRTFYLSRLAIDDDQFISTLELTPRLQELRLQERRSGPWPSLSNNFLLRLTIGRDESCLVPHLKVIVIERRFTLNPDLFIDMIRSRWTPIGPMPKTISRLAAVHFIATGRKEKYKKALEGLGILQDEGLMVMVPPKWRSGLSPSRK